MLVRRERDGKIDNRRNNELIAVHQFRPVYIPRDEGRLTVALDRGTTLVAQRAYVSSAVAVESILKVGLRKHPGSIRAKVLEPSF